MIRFLTSLLVFCAVSAHAAFGFRLGMDAKVLNWNYRNGYINVQGTRDQGLLVPTPADLVLASEFMRAVREAGLYPGKMLRYNLFMGPSIGSNNITSLYTVGIPLIDDVGFNNANRNVFGAVDDYTPVANNVWRYSVSGGLDRNGAAGAYLSTGLVSSNAFTSGTNNHVSLWVITANNEDVWAMGASDATGAISFGMLGPGYSGGIGTRLDLYGGGSSTADVSPTNHGYYIGNKAGTAAVLYKDRAAFSTNAAASALYASVVAPTLVFAVNCPPCGVPPTLPTSKALGAYGIGLGLTATDIVYLDGAVARVMTVYGRPR